MKKKKKIHKNRPFTKYPDQTSHTAETTDKIVFSTRKLFTWHFEVEH